MHTFVYKNTKKKFYTFASKKNMGCFFEYCVYTRTHKFTGLGLRFEYVTQTQTQIRETQIRCVSKKSLFVTKIYYS